MQLSRNQYSTERSDMGMPRALTWDVPHAGNFCSQSAMGENRELSGLSLKSRQGLRLAVRQAYVYGKQGDVKTQASHRWMPLDRSLAERLRQHKARLAPLAKSDDWVFANPQNGMSYMTCAAFGSPRVSCKSL